MTPKGKPTTLRQWAGRAWAERRQQQEQNLAEQARAEEARIRRTFKETFGGELDGVSGFIAWVKDGEEAELRFSYSSPHGTVRWQLWGWCPVCEQQCWSGYFYDLETLGMLLDPTTFEPTADHHCPEPEVRQLRPPDAVEAVLLEALRAWKEG